MAQKVKRQSQRHQQLIKKLKDEGEPNAIEWNGGLGEKQLVWLRSQLDESIIKNEKVIILCHFLPGNAGRPRNLLNYREVLGI